MQLRQHNRMWNLIIAVAVIISMTLSSFAGTVNAMDGSAAAEVPQITAQPVGVTVSAGETATFTVAAAVYDEETLSYQWQQSADNGSSWDDISGATAESYTTEEVDTADNGNQYRCMIVNNINGTTASNISDAAILTVNAAGTTADKEITAVGNWKDNIGEVKGLTGSGTKDKPYQISSAEELAYFAQRVNEGNTDYNAAYYELTQDIDLGAHEWTPIGNGTNNFKGYFDGKEHEINNVTIGTESNPDNNYEYVGLFGYAGEASTIQNIGVSVSIYSSKQSAYIGGLVGTNNNGTINNSYATGDVTGGESGKVGGLVGSNQRGEISNSYATGDVTGGESANVGGLVGKESSGTISKGYYNTDAKQKVDDSQQESKGIGYGTDNTEGKTSEQMQSSDFVKLLNENLEDGWIRWEKDENTGYPTFLSTTFTLPISKASFGGEGNTELFLHGKYIELGISNWGDFGTLGTKPTGFRGTKGANNRGSNQIGMSADHDGFNEGKDFPVDYYLPGTQEERFVVGYKKDGVAYTNTNSAQMKDKNMLSDTLNLSNIEEGKLKAKVVSTWNEKMEITQIISFNEEEVFYKNEVTIKNISDEAMDNVRYMRSFDPDNTQFRGGSYTTKNTILKTHEAGDEKAVVIAETIDGDPLTNIFNSKTPIFFYSKNPKARVSAFGFTNKNPYDCLAYDQARPKGYSETIDGAINITYDAGTLEAGKESDTFVYYTSLDNRTFDKIIKDIEKNEENTPKTPTDIGEGGSTHTVTFKDDGNSSSLNKDDYVTVDVNDEGEKAGILTTAKEEGQSIHKITVDAQKLEPKLKEEGKHAIVTVPFNNKADKAIAVLSGQQVKDMAGQQVLIKVKTENETYTLPAVQIDMESIADKLGKNEKLEDIDVKISIAEPREDMVKTVEKAAQSNDFTITVPAVNFTVQCSSDDKTVKITDYSVYVQRSILLPEDVDSAEITTAVVVEPDGSVRHVPTKVTKTDGIYYAEINSLTDSTYVLVYHPLEFKDATGHWAEADINDMGSRMVVNGVGHEQFEPDRDITRAEFAAIVVRALGLKPGTGSNPFADVAQDTWYCDYIKTAHAYDIINGYEDNIFKPLNPITREEAMTMAARAMAITGLKETADSQKLAGYTDFTQVGAWAKDSIANCVSQGIVTGKTTDMLAPKDNITRAEVAAIVSRLLRQSDLI